MTPNIDPAGVKEECQRLADHANEEYWRGVRKGLQLQREVFDAGFAACRAMGDNHVHYMGEQADSIFRRAMSKLAKAESA